MEYQFLKEEWWKLWPSWSSYIDTSLYEIYGSAYRDNYFFFGPFQFHWYGKV